ncbi:MAG: amidase [Candidatus Rokubacteria bacterium]|nr:amidase [Candidatus Rokubacteria bacterium]
MSHDVVYQPATRLAELIRDKRVSPVELVTAYLDRIDRFDGRLRAYVTVCREDAVAKARTMEVRIVRGEAVGPLGGVPFAVKDQYDTEGVRTTQGSRLFASHVPAETATVVVRLQQAGAILLGKLNMTELALGGTQDFPFGQPRNPWNDAHDPGGSSSGSGIATAAALCAVSLGEDTGGSVRSPAGFCGVVGVRPTWGRVSGHGVFPLSWSMDAPGPLARTVEDAAVVLGLIAGRDERDPLTSARPVPDYRAALTGDVTGVRIGVVTELTSGTDTAAEVRNAVETAAGLLGGLGARVEPVSLPLVPLAGAVFMALADSEGAGLHLDALRTRGAELDRGTRRRLVAAGLLPTAVTQHAARARAAIRAQVRRALDRFDVLLSPTAPSTAASIAAMMAPIESGEAAARRFFTRRSYTTPASLAGLPALSVPCGFSSAGLPIGLHLMGRAFDEATILRVAHAYEQATDWRRRPV